MEQSKSPLAIDSLCSEYNISNYSINDDFSIDVENSVSLYSPLPPLKFNDVKYHFSVNSGTNCIEPQNGNDTLENMPKTVGINFELRCLHLENLKGCPSIVGNSVILFNNGLKSFEGITNHIGGSLDTFEPSVTSLLHFPQKIGGDCTLYFTNIKTLDFNPEYIGGNLFCNDIDLLSDSDIKKLMSIESVNGSVVFRYEKDRLLRLLKIGEYKGVILTDIVNIREGFYTLKYGRFNVDIPFEEYPSFLRQIKDDLGQYVRVQTAANQSLTIEEAENLLNTFLF